MLGEEEVGVLDVLRIGPHDCEGPQKIEMSRKEFGMAGEEGRMGVEKMMSRWDSGCSGHHVHRQAGIQAKLAESYSVPIYARNIRQ